MLNPWRPARRTLWGLPDVITKARYSGEQSCACSSGKGCCNGYPDWATTSPRPDQAPASQAAARMLDEDLDKLISVSGSSREEINVATTGAHEVIVYSSAMDGLGTPTSDLDIYAISGHGSGREGMITGREAGPQGSLDVEWWDLGDITRICDAARACRARLDDLKVVHRMQAGIALTAAQPAGIRILKLRTLKWRR